MLLPAGSKDEMGLAVSNRFHVLEMFRKAVIGRGYNEISTPVLEYASTFTNENVDMKLQNMMKWFDSEGEIEVLRPDWTTAIARALSTQEKQPQKWAYQGSIFQRNKPGVEYHQAGVEIIHMPQLMGESESLLMAKSFIQDLGIGRSIIELGHTDIFESLIGGLDLSIEDAERLRQAMHDKKKDEVYQIALSSGKKEIADELAGLVDAYGSMEIIAEYEERWKNEETLLGMLKHIKKLATILMQSGSEDVLVDLGRVKNLPYYSGIMFRGFLQDSGAVCFSGGRYDRLYDQFGGNVSAVGLAFDVDVLAERLQVQSNKQRICIIATEESLVYAEQLRNSFKDSIVDVQADEVNLGSYDRILQIKTNNGDFEVIER